MQCVVSILFRLNIVGHDMRVFYNEYSLVYSDKGINLVYFEYNFRHFKLTPSH